jgi:hypothetical protein
VRLTPVQRGVVTDLQGGVILRTTTHSFPPYAEYALHGLLWRVQWRTFEALRRKGAITHEHSNCWVVA